MEWAVDMSTSSVSRVSNNSPTVKWNVVDSLCLCEFSSNLYTLVQMKSFIAEGVSILTVT